MKPKSPFLALLLFCVGLHASGYDFEQGGIYYDFWDTETDEETGQRYETVGVTYKYSYNEGGNSYQGDINIPSSVAYYDVTSCNIISYKVIRVFNSAFFNCDGLTSVSIPNTVTIIGNFAFGNCILLKSVTMGNSVKEIGASAFENCRSLTSIDIPNSVINIGLEAFQNCSGLTSVTMGNSVKSIGTYAFRYCSGLTSVTIGNSVTNINIGAFSGCTNLTSVYCKAVTPPSTDNRFGVFSNYDATLYVPIGCKSKYESVDPWRKFKTIVEMDFAGVEDVAVDDVNGSSIVGYYNAQGIRADEPWPGLNIAVYSDGSKRKVIYK